MVKEYILTKTNLFDFVVKKINYSFKTSDVKPMKNPDTIILHHTGTKNTIQKIINTHIKKQHFTSIGYHLLIGKNGQIYIARDLNKIGAHTFGYNTHAIGIALFGDFNKNEPTSKQIETLKKLISSLKETYKIKEIVGHNQATYNLLKKKVGTKIPKKNLTEIETDFKYYEFLKEIDLEIKKINNDDFTNIFNKLKTCPGINMSKPIQEFQNN